MTGIKELKNRVAELERIVKNLVKVGEVTSQDGAKCAVRIRLQDDEVITKNCRVRQDRTKGLQDYAAPSTGEKAIVLFLPEGIEEGIVLGTIYSDDNAPPTSSASERVVAGDPVKLGDETASDLVALAPLQETINDKIQVAFDGHIHSTASGPTDVPTANPAIGVPIGSLDPVGANKTKAK